MNRRLSSWLVHKTGAHHWQSLFGVMLSRHKRGGEAVPQVEQVLQRCGTSSSGQGYLKRMLSYSGCFDGRSSGRTFEQVCIVVDKGAH
jgi:hypothetical protein